MQLLREKKTKSWGGFSVDVQLLREKKTKVQFLKLLKRKKKLSHVADLITRITSGSS